MRHLPHSRRLPADDPDVHMTLTSSSTPVVTPTLVADQVYAYLEAEILSGRFPGGTRLRVRQLADLAGTSVMPVRDAINRLEEAGLAVRAPHRGAIVKEFSVAELLDVYAVRTLLEVAAAREGTRRISSAELDRMLPFRDSMNHALDEGRVADAMVADSQMLRVLYRASGNDVLCDMIDALWKQCHYYRLMAATTAYEQGDNTLWELERQVFRAVQSRDATAAGQHVRAALVSATTALKSRARS